MYIYRTKPICGLQSQSSRYLWWVNEIEGMVESEVDEAQERGVKLCESCHYSVVNICGVLKEQKTEFN